MPKARLFARSVTNTRPLNMTLNMECIEEPLSEAQLSSKTKFKDNYDRVSLFANSTFFKFLPMINKTILSIFYLLSFCQVTATLEEVIKDHGGKLICQSGAISGYQYTLYVSNHETRY